MWFASDIDRDPWYGEKNMLTCVSYVSNWIDTNGQYICHFMKCPHIQLRSYETAAEHVYEGKWGHFDMTKSTFKMLLCFWSFDTVEKRIRSFNAENLESLGQRAAKLPAIKLWEWLERAKHRTQADCFEWGRGRSADFFLRSPTLTACNFKASWPKETHSTSLKRSQPP